MRRQEFWLIVYGTFLISLIGVISFLFLLAEKNSSHLIWEIWGHLFPFPILYKAVVILLGATLLYQFKEKWGNLMQLAGMPSTNGTKKMVSLKKI